MAVLATAKAPLRANVYAADGTLLATFEELEAIAFSWVEEDNKRRLQKEFEDQAIQILFETWPEAFIEFIFFGGGG
jgi:hypothetical protein